MKASTSFEPANHLISLKDKTCTLSDGKKVSCTKITSCLTYNGKSLPNTIQFEVSWILDAKKSKAPRIFFADDESSNKSSRTSSILLEWQKLECITDTVHFADGFKDKATPIEVTMTYKIHSTSEQLLQQRTSVLEPVLDQDQESVRRDYVKIIKQY